MGQNKKDFLTCTFPTSPPHNHTFRYITRSWVHIQNLTVPLSHTNTSHSEPQICFQEHFIPFCLLSVSQRRRQCKGSSVNSLLLICGNKFQQDWLTRTVGLWERTSIGDLNATSKDAVYSLGSFELMMYHSLYECHFCPLSGELTSF